VGADWTLMTQDDPAADSCADGKPLGSLKVNNLLTRWATISF